MREDLKAIFENHVERWGLEENLDYEKHKIVYTITTEVDAPEEMKVKLKEFFKKHFVAKVGFGKFELQFKTEPL